MKLTDRTFGIELEVIVPSSSNILSRQNLVQTLRQQGFNIRGETYNHETRNHWKVVTDASLSARDGFAVEIVSPVLKGREGIEEVTRMCKALEGLGVTANSSCGFHVHHNTSDLTLRNFKLLYTLYLKHEGIIDSWMPPSRRNNAYCKSLTVSLGDLENGKKKIKQAKSLVELYPLVSCGYHDHAERSNGRYYKLNLNSYWLNGTIEFRQHSGTVNASKVTHWIAFTQRMVEATTEPMPKKSPFYCTETNDYHRLFNIYPTDDPEYKADRTETMAFYKACAKELSQRGSSERTGQ